MSRLARQALRFGLVGLANTALGLVAIYLLMAAGLGVVLSNVGGYALGMGLSYVLHRWWTFESRAPLARSMPRFVAVTAVAYVLNLAVVVTSMAVLDVEAHAAQALGVLAYAAAGFAGSRWFVFLD